MDSAFLLEWVTLLLRWAHLITGIAWIGASFYFVWLDNSLSPPTDPELVSKGVGGELWAVHGGGFYNPQKYLLAPPRLPAHLHWFKWEAYSTWLTGIGLLTALYYLQAATYMVDPAVAGLSPAQAVGIGVGALVLGWVVYDQLCRLLMGRSQLLFAALYFAFLALAAWSLTHLLSGRAAFVHLGAMIATAMSANVYFWIIPGQRIIVQAMRRGEVPEAIHGLRAKQRSVHNNYLTLPVLFCMISNHYAFTYTHPQAWAVLCGILLSGALIRHFFNLRHKGIVAWQYPSAGVALLLLVAIATAPTARQAGRGPAPRVADIEPIIRARCVACHAASPTLVPSAPAGVLLDTPERIAAQAERIHQQAVVLKAMPMGNLTGITAEERARLAAWHDAGARP